MDDWGTTSNGFDAETYLANQEKRQEISQLSQLAKDCYDELQYAKAEKFSQRAADLAEQIDDLSLMIHNRFCLAAAQGMQSKYQEALGTFTWLIEVAYNPDLNRELNDNDLWNIANGFMNFVAVGRNLLEMQVADLEKVLERGLDWLSTIGKNNWSAGLRLMRGTLWEQQGHYEKALTEMETALALSKRNPTAPGYALGAHILDMADLLQKMEKLPEAADYYQEVADGYEFHDDEKRWAWEGLAQVSIVRSDYSTAEQQALKSLELARGIESPKPMMLAYNVLGDVYWKQERIDLAITAKIQAWQYARQFKPAEERHDLYSDFAEIRLYQARQNHPHHYIPKAQQWLHRALPLAIRLDHQINSTTKQTKIRELQDQCAKLLTESPTPSQLE
jgi:tetratricopeptide (TPR) repeat protein